jgi:predicted metal-binding membrane protein
MSLSADFAHLPSLAAQIGRASARPRAVAIACVVGLAAVGWCYIGAANGASAFGDVGSLVRSICAPLSGGAQSGIAAEFALLFLMWSAMTLAMMLPSAAPMLLTYAEIADTAARKGERIVSPLVIAAGYCAIWLGFAGLGAAAQLLAARMPVEMNAGTALLVSGVLFAAAGLYQFSPLKNACLRACQQPFPFFFANWTTKTSGVFRLGLRQGLHCLGCCWAMMLLMFAVGTMNIVWMVLLGIVMTLEKIVPGARLRRGLGVVFIGAGGALMLAAIT